MKKFTLMGIMGPPDLAMEDRDAFTGKVAEFVIFKQKDSLLPRIFQALGIVLCTALLGQQLENDDVLRWGGFMLTAAISQIALFFVFAALRHNSHNIHWIVVLERGVQGLIAAGYGYVSIFLWPTTMIGEIGILCFLTIYLGNSVESAAGYFRLGIFFAALIIMPLIFRLMFLESEIGIAAGIFECFIFVFLCWRVKALAGKITENIMQKVDNNRQLADAMRENQLNIQVRKSNADFLTAASHDLRQPIHAIRLFISNSELLDPQDKIGREENRQNINMAFQFMEEMLDSLLNISYLNSDKPELAIEPVDIGSILERVYNEIGMLAVEKGSVVRIVRCNLTVNSNPIWLDRLLRNLLGNAVKYAPGGRILLGVRRKGNFARIQVLDTGTGIPETELEMIFEEFRTFKRKGIETHGSLGLGLAIVCRIAKLLDMKVDVFSEEGRGTVFSIDVPLFDPVVKESPGNLDI